MERQSDKLFLENVKKLGDMVLKNAKHSFGLDFAVINETLIEADCRLSELKPKTKGRPYPLPYKPSIGEIKENNRKAGKYFFSRDTNKFFGKQKFSVVINEKKTGYLLKVVYLDKPNDNIKYWEIVNNGEYLTTLRSYYDQK